MDNNLGCSSVNEESVDFLHELYKTIIDEVIKKTTDRNVKVLEFLKPEQIEAEFDLNLTETGCDRSHLMTQCHKLIKYSVHTGHPRFMNVLYSGLDPVGLGAACLSEALNCNTHTFESAPVFIFIENFLVQQLGQLVGHLNGDGLFVPGASFGTFLSFHLARYVFNNDMKKTGMFDHPALCLFCSVEAHYSVSKAAHFLGFGSDNVFTVATENGKMIPSCLEQAIIDCKNAGKIPLAVCATLGTTVLGAFDPLNDIADICDKYNLWLHGDAAWGGSVIFSGQHHHLMNGVERCDSLVISLHKLIGAQLQCAIVLVKKKGQLEACNGTSANYLFQPDKFYDVSYDVGDKTVQCGRKADAFKFWLMWKSRGHQGMSKVVDIAFDNAKHFTEKLKQRDGFKLVLSEFQYVNICFWYIPVKMRGQPETDEWWKALHQVAPKIKEGMVKAGSLMIAYQPLTSKGLVNFFRLVTGNPTTTREDMEFVLDEIDRLGSHLNPQML